MGIDRKIIDLNV